jgi:hypothetical protein
MISPYLLEQHPMSESLAKPNRTATMAGIEELSIALAVENFVAAEASSVHSREYQILQQLRVPKKERMLYRPLQPQQVFESTNLKFEQPVSHPSHVLVDLIPSGCDFNHARNSYIDKTGRCGWAADSGVQNAGRDGWLQICCGTSNCPCGRFTNLHPSPVMTVLSVAVISRETNAMAFSAGNMELR